MDMALFDWPLQKNTIGFDEKLALIKFILTSDRFTNGPKCREFENEWSRWQGCKYSLFVSSGSTANTLLLDATRELLFGKNEKLTILCPAVNWATNISTFKQQGHDIYFYDIDYNRYSPTVESLEYLQSQGVKPDIIYATHLMGFGANLNTVRSLWPEAILLEDCCESHGAITHDIQMVGNLGLGSTFSFYFGHHMTTIEGGMVCTNNEKLYNLMRAKRSHGLSREMYGLHRLDIENQYEDIDPAFLFPTEGYNFRNNELGAVIGSVQLKKLKRFIYQRAANYHTFENEMHEHPAIKHLPNHWGNSAMTLPFHCVSAESRDYMMNFLRHLGVETRPFLVGNLLRQPFMKDYDKSVRLPNTEEIHTHSFYIGNNHFINERQVKALTDKLHQYQCVL